MPVPIIPISATPGPRLVPKAGADGKLAAGWLPFAAPDPIGSTTPNTGAFTALTATSLDVAGNIRTNSGTPPSFAGAGSIIASVPDASGLLGAILHAQVGDNAGAFGGFSVGYGAAINWLVGISKGIADTTALAFYENASAAAGRFYIATGGNTGIGVFPTTKLHIQAGNQYQSIRLQSTSTIGAGIQLQPSATGGRNWLLLATANGASAGGGLLAFWDESGGGARATINASGHFGVGVNSAATRLHALLTGSGTNDVVHVATLGRNGGAVVAGFGSGILFTLEGATTDDRAAAVLEWLWNDPTNSAAIADFVFSSYFNNNGSLTKREGIRIRGGASATQIGFFGVTPVTRPTALTAQLTTITHTAPSTPDYALQNLTNSGGYGFATLDEGNTLLSVVANLQTRLGQLETKIQALGLVA